MIIFENGAWQTDTEHPNENYLADTDCPQPKWVVADNSELANKIMSMPCWEPITDDEGHLIDITAIKTIATVEEHIADLKAQLAAIDQQAIRPLRAIAAGTATDEDRAKLTELETHAAELRKQLNELTL